MGVSGHYYTPEKESLVPDMRLGGLQWHTQKFCSGARGGFNKFS